MYQKYIKRSKDVILAVVVLLLSLPLLLLVALCLAVANRGKVLFRQQRPGLHGKPFYLYKFRTMADLSDANGNLLPDEDRLKGVGSWVRKTSLDELPQLYNVLRGELSLVGPRPLLMEYLPLYSEEQAKRHLVKPGITGWAQVNGRNAISWEQKFSYDIWYVQHQSFKTDSMILYKTFRKVWSGAGVNSPGYATTPKFSGEQSIA